MNPERFVFPQFSFSCSTPSLCHESLCLLVRLLGTCKNMFLVTFTPFKCRAQGEIYFSRAYHSGIVSSTLSAERNTPKMIVGREGVADSWPGRHSSLGLLVQAQRRHNWVFLLGAQMVLRPGARKMSMLIQCWDKTKGEQKLAGT